MKKVEPGSINLIASINMGKRHHHNRNIRGLKMATAAICIIGHSDGSTSYGIGILYPDKEHFYFTEVATTNPENLWRGMYAASKMYLFTDKALEATVMLADETVLLKDRRFDELPYWLTDGHNATSLREKILAKEIPPSEIQKIVAGFQEFGIIIDDPFAKESSAGGRFFQAGIFSQMNHTSIPLSLSI